MDCIISKKTFENKRTDLSVNKCDKVPNIRELFRLPTEQRISCLISLVPVALTILWKLLSSKPESYYYFSCARMASALSPTVLLYFQTPLYAKS